MRNRRMVISSMRNEGPYIVEWVAWNRVIGFTDIVIGTNDSLDASAAILSILSENGVIRFIDNVVAPDEVPQHVFNEKVQKLDIYQDVEWLAVLDADEFLNIHLGDGWLEDLLCAHPDVDIVQLNWAVFGDGGENGFSDTPVTARFTKRIATQHRINGGCKCLTRLPQRFGNIRNHNPVDFRGNGALSVLTGGGVIRQIDGAAKLTGLLQYTAAEEVSFAIAQVNHYATKTRDEYLLRQQRGRGAVPAAQGARPRHDDRYFDLRAAADVPDLSIRRHEAALMREIEALMRIPGLTGAVGHAKRWYSERIADLAG